MPNPKRRHSKARRDRRRAHDFLAPLHLSTCSNCHNPVMPHRACAHCGYYKGVQVINGRGSE
ncbi:MAG: 50S ribosomal protein L32 [Acidobacteria bacterium]|nr:50S ribosomal protein L32 [Acidobacteriota bacterium]MBI3657409.1 50S ribosomal protein L32 [Acidobacteriota bacterium]